MKERPKSINIAMTPEVELAVVELKKRGFNMSALIRQLILDKYHGVILKDNV